MANISLDAFYSDYLYIDFDCPKCGNRVHSDKILIPTPDLAAEKSSDSVVTDSDWVTCENCDTTYDIDIASSFYGIEIEIDGVDEENDNIDYSAHYDAVVNGDEIIVVDNERSLRHLKYKNFVLRSLCIPKKGMLSDFNISFNDGINVLIGENGSGKSTLLEGIALIFADLSKYVAPKRYQSVVDFEYNLTYSVEDARIDKDEKVYEIAISNRIIDGKFEIALMVDGLISTNPKKDLKEFLPSKIGLYYAGITDRLLEISRSFESEYKSEILDSSISLSDLYLLKTRPFLYIKNEQIGLLLLSLLMVDENELSDIGINILTAEVEFVFAKPSWAKDTVNNYWGGKPIFKDVLNILKESPIQENISEESIRIVQNTSYIKDEFYNLYQGNIVNFVFDVFDYFLYSGLLKSIKISWGNSDGDYISNEFLSEGQKQLITIRTLSKLLKYQCGFILFDEPDTFLHPKWQQEFVGMLKKELPNIQIFITSHSPNIVSSLSSKELFIMDKGQVNKFYFNPYGKNVGDILIDHFNAKTNRNIEVQQLIDDIEVLLKSSEYNNSIELITNKVEELSKIIDPTDVKLLAIRLEMLRLKNIINEKVK